MNLFKTLATMAFACFGISAQAQSVTPCFQSPLHDSWGHVIYPESFTFIGMVDLDSQNELRRTVEVDEFGTWTDYEEDLSLNQLITSDGPDQFNVHLAIGSSPYRIRVRYRYTSDPDGSGNLNSGDNAVPPIVIDQIQPKADPQSHVAEMYMYGEQGNQMHLKVASHRYAVSGSPFIAYRQTEVRHMASDQVVWSSTMTINPAGNYYNDSDTYEIYLENSGEHCVTVRVLYSHDGPGYSDFTNALVATTNGNNCEWSNGLPTGVHAGAYDLSLVTYAYGVINVAGVFDRVRISDVSGRVVAEGTASHFETASWSTGAYFVSVTDTIGVVHTKKLAIGYY